jgi:hypothetical protein
MPTCEAVNCQLSSCLCCTTQTFTPINRSHEPSGGNREWSRYLSSQSQHILLEQKFLNITSGHSFEIFIPLSSRWGLQNAPQFSVYVRHELGPQQQQLHLSPMTKAHAFRLHKMAIMRNITCAIKQNSM